jgi:hypothetical protein
MKERTSRLLEFFIVGIAMGIFEDVLAVWAVTGEKITFSQFWIVFMIALPFAFISEWVVDHPRFPHHFLPFLKSKKSK